jgi:hypothetical protein
MTSKPTVYCASCGAENPSARGACLLCYAVLHAPGGGLPCPACGHDNVKEGRFCASCGAPFAPGASRVPGLVDSALAVLHGGIANLGPDHDLHAEEEDFLGGMAEEPAVQAAPAVAPPAFVAPAPAAELDDEMLHMPPSALDLQEAAATPAPLAASRPVAAEDFAPPPPPAASRPVAAPQPVAPMAPAAPISLDDDDMMPPPPPPGLGEVAPAAAAPAPAAPAAPAAKAPAAPAAAAATSGSLDGAGLIDPLAQAAAEAGSDEDFGDWSLEFPADNKSE